MAAAILAGAGGRTAPARNVRRPLVARLAADPDRPRRTAGAHLLGLDCAGLATLGADREAREWVARRAAAAR